LLSSEPRESPGNQSILAQRAQAIEGIRSARAPKYDALEASLSRTEGAQVTERFWLINGVVAKLPIGQVRALAARAEVAHVEERFSGEKPPVFTATESSARSRTGTDPYFSATVGFIGLIDTGVRSTHNLFNSPSHLAIQADCENGTSNNCFTGTGLNPDDSFWNHGTSSASELTANGRLGNTNRGMTQLFVDSWKVYTECAVGCGYDRAAGVRAFQAGVTFGDFVFDVEVQDTDGPNGSSGTAADAAFDTGTIVVSANGNFGSGAGTVRSPADARKVLGVGAYDVVNGSLQSYSGRGPTADGRFKPDFTAPTNVNAASNASATALQNFGGTSAATPHGAAAAALLSDRFGAMGMDTSPGQIYAAMINAGSGTGFDNNNGTGKLKLESLSKSKFFSGNVTVTPGAVIDIPLTFTPTSKVEAAIWWPETTAGHNDVDLVLLDPKGATAAFSMTSVSVFEKVRNTKSRTGGTWKVRISAFNLTTSSQQVYWTLYVK
jgi:hypothetical protein